MVEIESCFLICNYQSQSKELVHLLDLQQNRLLGGTHDISPKFDNKEWQSFCNVLELRAVGIHLKSKKSSCLGERNFTRNWTLYGDVSSLISASPSNCNSLMS